MIRPTGAPVAIARRSTALLVLLALALVLGAAPAAAVSVDRIVLGLRADPLFVSPASQIAPDRMLATSSLRASTTPVYAVVVSETEVAAEEFGIDGITLRLVEALAGPDAVVLVVTDEGGLQAGGGELTGQTPTVALEQVIATRLDEPFTTETLTDAITDFVVEVGKASPVEPVAGAASTTRRTIGLVGLVAVAVLGVGSLLYSRWRRGRLPFEDDDVDEHLDDEYDDQGDDDEHDDDDEYDEDDDDGAESRSGWRGTPTAERGTTRP